MEKQTIYIYGDCGLAAGWEYDQQTALMEEGLKPLYKLVITTFWNGEQREDWYSTKQRFIDDEWIKQHPTYYGQDVTSIEDFDRLAYAFN